MDDVKTLDARFELRLTLAELDALAAAAFRRRRSNSAIVREALAEWHERHRDDGCVR
jgi:hypothetical protein